MLIKLRKEHVQIINTHGESTYPDECCGVILGYLLDDTKIVEEVILTANAWSTEGDNFAEAENLETTRRRYAIAPQVMLKMQKEARSRNLSIIGIYHSHPDYPAIPSEWDRLYAWPVYSYIIVSVQNSQARELQSWCLDENHQFQTETIELII
ncbi:Mov34/MPN/PAD-1 family protein [Richelia sinica FACHB-800]|uniref:Mov34/MPN/PAD-1 family protein n=1 Tax=Richelia sinica FACHB-800 TaxID=1357546 RepID=A0A975T630_9NOST|nr:M67 family metallopeptidase [Richelia sinica]MBD2663714.1 M67 family metallopeptidase [Richelia sinica FACHB-800]QXE22719.1 Mov34/MPN/PAD-1 family protein [Richelia sinica FACHB-800]